MFKKFENKCKNKHEVHVYDRPWPCLFASAITVLAVDFQKQANTEYRLLDQAEKESLKKQADEKNSGDLSDSRIPRQPLIKKLVANIHANVSLSLSLNVF